MNAITRSFTGRKRIRHNFGRIPEVAPMPNLIDVQRASYEAFLQMNVQPDSRLHAGLQEVFKSVFPIDDFAGRGRLEFVHYELEEPKYDVEECIQRGMTYAAPLKVILRLIVWDVDEDTGARSIRDIKEQPVYMGDMPLMTDNGTFIINGTERVIVSQMHRSPGVFFDHDKGKTHSSGKYLFAARVIPYRGSWLDFEFDSKDLVYVRIDRKRKLPVTTLLYALEGAATQRLRAEREAKGEQLEPGEVRGMDQEEILSYFYGQVVFDFTAKGWARPFDPDAFRGVKLLEPIVDAETGEVVADAEAKLTQRQARRIAEKTKEVLVGRTDLLGRFVAEDLVNAETGEIYAEAGEELTEPKLTALEEAGVTKLPTLAVDQSNGPWIRNTLAVDKNSNRDDALIDIYRVMRPGEPPTPETAEGLFRGLFFDPDRYDLSAVGRVKMNMRLGLDDVAGFHARAAQGRPAPHGEDPQRAEGRPRADRRHRQSRQPAGAFRRRADGEPVPHRPAAHGAGDPRAHGLGGHRHCDAARPDQCQAGGGRGARILRFVAAVAVHGPDQSAVRGDAQAASLGARAGRSDARARRLRGARRAPDALRPHLPDRDAGRPEHRPDQLARHLRQGQQVRLHRDAVHVGEGRRGAEGAALSLRDGGGEAGRRPGRCADGRQAASSPRTWCRCASRATSAWHGRRM